MFKKFSLTDKLLFIAAILSLIYSEILFFNGYENQAIFIGLWVFLRIAQALFGKQTKPGTDLSGCSAKPDATNFSEALSTDEFRFFKRKDGEIDQSDDDQALAAIEQEMLAIKQLFADGHILKDVYVTETRRLYVKAKAFRP